MNRARTTLGLKPGRDADGEARQQRDSMSQIDHNATGGAAAEQSAEDAASLEAGSPAEEGGEG